MGKNLCTEDYYEHVGERVRNIGQKQTTIEDAVHTVDLGSHYGNRPRGWNSTTNATRYLFTYSFYRYLVAECLTVASGIFAMLGVASQLSIATMESFASTFQMPVVIPSAVEPTSPPRMAPRPPVSPSQLPRSTAAGQAHRRPAAVAGDDLPYAIFVRPSYDDAVFALIRHFEWKHFYYLYDTEQGLCLFFSLISHLLCDFFSDRSGIAVSGDFHVRCTFALTKLIAIFTITLFIADNGICVNIRNLWVSI